MRLTYLTSLMLFLLSIPTTRIQAQGEVLEIRSNSNQKVVLNLKLEMPEFRYENEFTHVQLKGLQSVTTRDGAPQLPILHKLIRVPEGTTARFSIQEGPVSYYDVLPFPYQKPVLRNENNISVFSFDSSIYFGKKAFPENQVVLKEPVNFGNQRVAELFIHPVQYFPEKGQLRFVKEIQIELYFTPTKQKSPSTQPTVSAATYREDFLINPDKIDFRSVEDEAPRMLIITHDLFYESIKPLVAWKNRKGIRTSVIKTSQISGFPTPEDIKIAISDFAKDSALSYVLLVGDVNFIPPFYGVRSSLTDHNYSTIIGSDYLPDVPVGRFSVNDAEECRTYVDKTIKYERYPMVDMTNGWFNKASIVASNANLDDKHGQHLVRFMNEQDFSVVDDLRATLNHFSGYEILNKLNEGRSWVFYIGHGDNHNWRTMGYFSIYTIENDLLNSTYLPAIVSVACSNSDLDVFNYSFGERWLNIHRDRGAVCFIGATEDTRFYLSDTLGKQAMMSYINGRTNSIGAALDYGKMKMFESFPDNEQNETEETMQQFLLLGDPSLQPWTQVPAYVFADFPKTMKRGVQSLDVKVKSLDTAIANARVCISNQDFSVYESALTDSLGQVVFDVDFQDSGYIYLTVTGRNLIPFEDSILVSNEVGIEKDFAAHQFSVYPNPAIGKFMIKSNKHPIEEIRLYDPKGIEMFRTSNYNQRLFHWDKQLPEGLYVLYLTDNKGNHITKKVLILGK